MKSEWKICTIGELCDTVSDTYKRNDKQVVLINTSDVSEGKVLNHSPVANENLKGQFKKTFRRDDILYSEIRPANKRFAYIDFDNTENYIASTKLMVLRPYKKIVLPRFLYNVLKSQALIKELQHLAETRSGTFPQITFSSELARMCVKIPDLETQHCIVSVLSALDDKIELNNKINKNLEEQAQAIFKSWFVDFEPFGGIMPDDFESIPIYDMADYINGAAFKKSEYGEIGLPIIKITELKNGITDSTQFCFVKKDEKYYIFDKDILFSWSGNPETSIDTFLWSRGNAILNQHTFRVVSKFNAPAFTYFLLKYLKPQFTRMASNKQTTGLGHITVSDLKRLQFNVSQKAISEFEMLLTPMFDKIYAINKENQHLSALRDDLLPKLMNGEIDVSKIGSVENAYSYA